MISSRNNKGQIAKTHGLSGTKIYRCWRGIIDRCCNPNHSVYKTHGARGITVCPEWQNSFQSFLDDVGMPPSAKHCLTRIDNSKNFTPDNVKWATKANNRGHTPHNKSHGMTESKEYFAWVHMKGRCNNPKNEKYPNYGGRGIKVCDRWESSFESFLSDMGEAPTKKHTIDRIDVNGDYCPDNCRWATFKEQSLNKTNSVRLQFRGETKTLSEWCDELDLPRPAVEARISRGWTIEKALTKKVETPSKTGARFITFRGKTQRLAEWAREVGIHEATIATRIDNLGWSIQAALTTPKQTNQFG